VTEITIERLERGLAICAYLVVLDGPVWARRESTSKRWLFAIPNALKQHYKGKLRVTDVKEMFLQMGK
jgi:hypothetical protein